MLGIVIFARLDRAAEGYQLVDRFDWIRAGDTGFAVQYVLGVDGLSAPLVLLTGLLGLASVLVSWRIDKRVKEYFAWLLILETAVAGVFLSLDLIQFFFFWELELLPMYMLISIWGSGRPRYSAMKFLLFTMAGSALMLAGFLVLGLQAGTFDIAALTANPPTEALVPLSLVFWLIIAAFLVKLPVFPLHSWLPDAHTDAPTAVSVMLAGVLLKMGGYGILRIVLPILPGEAQDFRVILAIIAAVTVIYGAILTLQQRDLKRLVAYSSVSHMGYVLLGVSAMGAAGLSGAALQMFSHGVITGLLFIVVGLMYDRTHTRQISDLSGLVAPDATAWPGRDHRGLRGARAAGAERLRRRIRGLRRDAAGAPGGDDHLRLRRRARGGLHPLGRAARLHRARRRALDRPRRRDRVVGARGDGRDAGLRHRRRRLPAAADRRG